MSSQRERKNRRDKDKGSESKRRDPPTLAELVTERDWTGAIARLEVGMTQTITLTFPHLPLSHSLNHSLKLH